MIEIKTKRTIYTIAKELNLSPGTISKILNNTGTVSDQTRKRVLEYIEEVGYVPVTSARMLKSKRTYTIGVIFAEDLDIGLEHSFFSSILQHFKTYVEDKGYELSFIVPKLGKHKLTYYQWCINKRVDGVYIVVGNYDDPNLDEIINSEIPCVSTDMFLPNLHTVISDNKMGIELLFDYIQQHLEAKTVGLIAGPQKSPAFRERKEHFETLAASYGLSYQPAHVVLAESYGFSSGYKAANQLVDDNQSLPEVLIVSSDDIALGVIKALGERQIRVPDDIQVTGFDDIVFAKHFTPALTTIAQDRKQLGETAAKNLISLIERPGTKIPEVVKVPVSLIARASTKSK